MYKRQDDLRVQYKPQAERQVKVRLGLEKIAELENLKPTEEETLSLIHIYRITLLRGRKPFP